MSATSCSADYLSLSSLVSIRLASLIIILVKILIDAQCCHLPPGGRLLLGNAMNLSI